MNLKLIEYLNFLFTYDWCKEEFTMIYWLSYKNWFWRNLSVLNILDVRLVNLMILIEYLILMLIEYYFPLYVYDWISFICLWCLLNIIYHMIMLLLILFYFFRFTHSILFAYHKKERRIGIDFPKLFLSISC